jgi:hypothetical protein
MFIKGLQNKTYVVNGVEPSNTLVDDLKVIISQEFEMVPVPEQRLLFAGLIKNDKNLNLPPKDTNCKMGCI